MNGCGAHRLTLRRLWWLLPLLLAGCLGAGEGPRPAGPEASFSPADLIKSDVDLVLEIQQREARRHLRTMMEQLYRLNPRELANGPHATVQAAVARVFDQPPPEWRFAELGEREWMRVLFLAFDAGYEGDRVFALMAGLTSMVMASYGYRGEFFLLDEMGDPQRYYNSARNVEMAVAKLTQGPGRKAPFLIMEDASGGSVAQLTGKVSAIQDATAQIVAQKSKRAFKHAFQLVASTVLLPL